MAKKYVDAELLKKELNRLIKDRDKRMKSGTYVSTSYVYEDILDLINSLQQEQPEVDFKIEERKWIHDAVDNIFPEDGDFMSEVDFRKILKYTAHHFYELGLNARKEE